MQSIELYKSRDVIISLTSISPLFFLGGEEYWSGLPFPFPGDLPDSGIEPRSPAAPALQADSLPLSHQGSPRKRKHWKNGKAILE